MPTPASPISEQTALYDRQTNIGDPDNRLTADDPLFELGNTFIVNGLVSPTTTAAARLIPREVTAGVTAWLQSSLARNDDDLYLAIDESIGEHTAVATIDALSAAAGLELSELPASYADWRLSVELYVVIGPAAYLLAGDLAIRSKVLSNAEVGMLFSRRALPLLASDVELMGIAVVLVAIPGRLGAIGGLRGYRRALIDAGRGLQVLHDLSDRSARGADGWRWETEFLDDAVGAAMSVDGVERIPLALGLKIEPATYSPGDAASPEGSADERG